MKERAVPKELQILRALRPRMNFNEDEESYYQYKEKGFEGEVNFDTWAEPLGNNMLFLNDIDINHNNNHFQIDSFGISSGILHNFEIKNFEGDYIIKKDKWYSPKGNIVKNPLLQLEKTETLLNQLVKNMGRRIIVKSHLIFINPEFHLYDIPTNLPIIYPAQLTRFRERIHQDSSKLTRSEIGLAEKLLSICIEEPPYSRLPEYSYTGLRKGIVCPGCGVFYKSLQKCFYCEFCGGKESCSSAILRSVEEFKLLFPERRVTCNIIYDWCSLIKDIRTIRRALQKHFTLIGHSNSSYYI